MREDQTAGDIVHGVPPIAVSTGSTLANRTGSWKYIRPIYQDMVAPCNAACPVGTDVEGYMNLLREGKVAEARDLLLRENPMPAVTGRVCDHPCQTACNRAFFDDAVNIHAVERMLGDLEPEVRAPVPARTRKEKVAVVGSGPAGLACAYHLARLGYAVNLFEAEPRAGRGAALRHPGVPPAPRTCWCARSSASARRGSTSSAACAWAATSPGRSWSRTTPSSSRAARA